MHEIMSPESTSKRLFRIKQNLIFGEIDIILMTKLVLKDIIRYLYFPENMFYYNTANVTQKYVQSIVVYNFFYPTTKP